MCFLLELYTFGGFSSGNRGINTRLIRDGMISKGGVSETGLTGM